MIQHFLLNLVLPKLEKENFNFLIYHPNASEELISFNLLFKNSWKKCLDTNFKIEISKPVYNVKERKKERKKRQLKREGNNERKKRKKNKEARGSKHKEKESK